MTNLKYSSVQSVVSAINKYFNQILGFENLFTIGAINIKIKFDPVNYKLHCIVTDVGNDIKKLMYILQTYGTTNEKIAQALDIKYRTEFVSLD